MGSQGSVPRPSKISSLGNVPDELVGISCDASGENLLAISSNGLIQIRSLLNNQCFRMLNLEPTSCCYSRNGTWIVGFKTGQISEFDMELNLIRSFTPAGKTRAHNSEITRILPVSQSSVFIISSSTDNYVRIWNENGQCESQILTPCVINAICCNERYLWIAESSLRVSVHDLLSNKVYRYNSPTIVLSMTIIDEYNGCLVSLHDGQIALFSYDQVVSQFPFVDRKKVLSAFPLCIEKDSGLLSYFAVDNERNATLRVLEYIVSDMGKYSHIYSYSGESLICIDDTRFISHNLTNLKKASLKNLPEMELPRKKIVSFCNESTTEENQTERSEEEMEEDDN